MWMGPTDSTVSFLVGADECVCWPGGAGGGSGRRRKARCFIVADPLQ